MAGVVGALMRAGLAVKLGHLRQATSSYIRDRSEQGRSTVSGYVIGGAFYAAAGIFMIAALLVGAMALFRWVEIKYGLFQAFGATAAALIVLTALSAVVAASSMHPPKKSFPSLGSRLRVALHAVPPKQVRPTRPAATTPSRIPADNRDHVGSARNTAAAILRAPATPKYAAPSSAMSPLAQRASIATGLGLLGWALAQRHARNTASPARRGRN